MSNIGRKVKIINGEESDSPIFNTINIVGQIGEIIDDKSTLFTIQLKDGTKRKVWSPDCENRIECEWYDEPVSYVGRRVRLSAEYMRDNPGYGEYGTVTDDNNHNIKGCWIVKMDNGSNSVPFAPGSTSAQCSLISEQDDVKKIKYTVEYIKGKRIAVYCPTQEDWNKVTEVLDCDWATTSNWHVYKEESCINANELEYARREYYTQQRYEIISAQTFLTANNIKTMTATEKKIKELEEQLNELKESLKAIPKYKIGDWVVTTNSGADFGNNSHHPAGYLFQIGYIQDCDLNDKWYGKTDPSKADGVKGCNLRPATPEEIAKASKVKVTIGDAGKEVTIEQGKITAHDGTSIDISKINSLVLTMTDKTLNTWAVKFHTVDVGCVKNITLAQLQKVQEEYKRLNP